MTSQCNFLFCFRCINKRRSLR